MQVISVFSLKGGSGKTTISLLMAQSLKRRGYSICLIDSDMHQQSAMNWAKVNDITCYGVDKGLTPGDLRQLEKDKYDYVIIDGMPATTGYSANILYLSDLVIVPVPPTQLSFASFIQDNHQAILRQVKAKGINLWVVINGVTPYNQDDVYTLEEYLRHGSINLDDVYRLGQRKAFVIDYNKSLYDKKNSRAINELEFMVDGLGVRCAP